jgi:hypothetical protein
MVASREECLAATIGRGSGIDWLAENDDNANVGRCHDTRGAWYHLPRAIP